MPSLWRRSFRPGRKPLNNLLRTRLANALVTPHHIDDYLALLDGTWSIHAVRARVTRIEWTTRRAVSLWLEPNELWRGFRAGQHVALSIVHDGVQHTRCFSISSAPEDGAPLRVTIQVVPDGHVSEWVWSHAQVGDIVGLSQAQGDFTLPHALPRQLLFISGGSGITPLMSMMRHLSHVRYSGRVHWIHYARHEVIFADELSQLTASEPGFQLHLHVTRRGEVSSRGRDFSELQLQRDVPRWRQCETFVCGPTRLMDAVRSHWQRHGAGDRLHEEFFRLQPRFPLDENDDRACELSFQRSGVQWRGHAAGTLLDQAEAAGISPASGCRMGICHSCVCRKVSGVVRNEITGQLSSEPDEEIQLCISTPRSDVVLDL